MAWYNSALACGNSSVVEHDLAKVGVAGSNPVSRSSNFHFRPGSQRRNSDFIALRSTGAAPWVRAVTVMSGPGEGRSRIVDNDTPVPAQRIPLGPRGP
jgi:hypothetical protein